jgi:transcriptional regulator with XRE-family HTH domain
MGYARPKPKRLAEKLKRVRITLGLSQPEMLRRLGVEELIAYHRISEYETDKREPLLMVLLQYARVAGIHVEDLIDDELDLPEKLPGNVTYRGIRRKSAQRSKRL